MEEVEESQKQKEVTQISMTEQPNPQEQRVHSLLLPFSGCKGTTVVKNLNKTFKNKIPNNVEARSTYTGQKLQLVDSTLKIKQTENISALFIIQNACTEDHLQPMTKYLKQTLVFM